MATTATATPTGKTQDQERPNKGGRPRVGGLPPGGGPTQQFKVTPGPGQLDAIDAAAAAAGISRSAMIRRFIDEGLAREGRKTRKSA